MIYLGALLVERLLNRLRDARKMQLEIPKEALNVPIAIMAFALSVHYLCILVLNTICTTQPMMSRLTAGLRSCVIVVLYRDRFLRLMYELRISIVSNHR